MTDNAAAPGQTDAQSNISPVEKIAAALRELLASPADVDVQERGRAALAAFDAVPNGFIVVQEGGASGEYYPHGFDNSEDAFTYQEDCARGSYRTSAAFEVPGFVMACGPALYELLESVATAEYEYADVEDEEDEEEGEDA